MNTRVVQLAAVALATFVAAPALPAQGLLELGAFGSMTRFDESLALDDLSGGGARVSVFSGAGWTTFMLEAEGSYAQTKLGATTLRYIPARARLGYVVPVGRQASLLLGAGAVRTDYRDDTDAASEWGYSGLIGFRMQLGGMMALRIDGNYDYIANPMNESATIEKTANQSISAGLSFPLWRDRGPAPMIDDEPRDYRPEPAAPVAVQPAQPREDGPDADRDGVPDRRDACANTASGASVDTQGCQVYRDSDGDGVVDGRDACPATQPGEATDGRGCPTTKDEDRDGVADSLDRCANTPAGSRIDVNGCPRAEVAVPKDVDSDGDGVDDSRDRCAATPPGTSADASGCPILFNKTERTVELRGVTFAPWKDELTPASLAVLDEVARQLIAAPSVRVEVAGHTDSGGARSRNIRMSLARAESVRAYLVMKGVDADRLVARGYGPDQPLVSNKTEAGRSKNRRVELRRLD